MSQKFLITGVAGFIGFHLCKKLLEKGKEIIAIDNLNSYYDVQLKKNRLKELENLSKIKKNKFIFYSKDLNDMDFLIDLFKKYNPNIIVNLAAQAGVRYSLENPREYINSNIIGFFNILECCKKYPIKQLIYASSSSVYGGNSKIPFSETHEVKKPVSLYAATKLSNELMAYTYSHLHNIPTVGLRFFTVYGPWGRPDMAPMIFANSIIKNIPIKIFNYGDMSRDFTYIDDVIEFISRVVEKPLINSGSGKNFNPSIETSSVPALVFNIGNNKPIKLMDFINILEKELGLKAIKTYDEMQPGDVKDTYADTNKIESWLRYKPKTDLSKGIKEFVKWYKNYYKI